jgi:hypothetical protein
VKPGDLVEVDAPNGIAGGTGIIIEVGVRPPHMSMASFKVLFGEGRTGWYLMFQLRKIE